METEQAPEHRDLSQSVRRLKAHVRFKMDRLPELAQRFKLDENAVAGLRSNLQSELDSLSKLPENATLGEIMENHFKQEANFIKNLGIRDKAEDS